MIHQFLFHQRRSDQKTVDLGSDLITGQSEVKLVDPSFRPSAHALFSGRGRQKSQSCRLGQPEMLFKLAIVELFKGILVITEVPWSVVLGQI